MPIEGVRVSIAYNVVRLKDSAIGVEGEGV